MNISAIQLAVKSAGLDAWLLTDYHLANKPALKLLGLDPAGHFSRRWFYLIPQSGMPIRLVHSVEATVLDHLPGHTITYFGRDAMIKQLKTLLPAGLRVAMEYSPMGRLPGVSCVDAGTIELIRSLGVDISSSGDLLQGFTSRWNDEALNSHRLAAVVLRETVDAVWGMIKNSLSSDGKTSAAPLTEFQIQRP